MKTYIASNWSDLLLCYSTQREKPIENTFGKIGFVKGRKVIQLTSDWENLKCGKHLTDADIIQISQTIVNFRSKIDFSTLKKVETAFTAYLNSQTQEKRLLKSSLESFFVRFAKWANGHQRLAKILCVITLGWLSSTWNKGNQICQHLEATNNNINQFTHFSEQIQAEITPPPQTPFSKEILGEILSFLNESERYQLCEWDEAKRAMEYTDGFKWKLLESYQNKLLSVLDPIAHADEIRLVKELKEYCKTFKYFQDYTTSPQQIENLIIRLLLSALNYFYDKKRFNSQFMQIREIALLSLYLSSFTSRGLIIPDHFLKDPEFVLEALKVNGCVLELIPREKRTRELVALAIKHDRGSYDYMATEAFAFASPELQGDQDLIWLAVQNNGLDVKKYLYRLPDDGLKRKLAKEAVCQNGMALQHIPKHLVDRELVLDAVLRKGEAIQFAPEPYKSDPEIVLEAVKSDPEAYLHLPDVFKGKKEIALSAVSRSTRAADALPPSLFDDRDIILAAAKKDQRFLLRFPMLFNDREVVLASFNNVRESGLLKRCPHFANDKEVVLAAVKADGMDLYYASDELKKDEDIVLAAVMNKGVAISYAHESLREDKDIAIAAIKNEGAAWEVIGCGLKQDKSLALQAVSNDSKGKIAYYFPNTFLDDPEVITAAINKNGLSIQYASAKLKKDKQMVLHAVQKNGRALKYIDPSLKDDRDVVKAALNQKGGEDFLAFASPTLQKDAEMIALANQSKVKRWDVWCK